MFTSNKCRYLKGNGWNVRVFYFNKGRHIIIENLREYEDNYIPEMRYGYYYWNKRQRKKLLDRLCAGIANGDYVVVESHLMNLTYWGELMAQRIGAKSILNCMEETVRQITQKEANFIEYKVKRHEVLNGSPRAFQRYFGKLYKTEYAQYTNDMIPLCSNVVSEDVEFGVEIFEGANFNLLSIGRLDKPYIQTMLFGVKRFVEKYSHRSFNLLFVGGSPDGSIEKQIQKTFNMMPNVNVYLLGYMFPVPANLIRTADVAMASANSVLVTAGQGVMTISYDINDYQAIGIYGYTTDNRFSRQGESVISTETLLEQILIDKRYNKPVREVSDFDQLENAFAPQLDFVLKSSYDRKAFNVSSIHSYGERCVANLKRIVLTFFRKW